MRHHVGSSTLFAPARPVEPVSEVQLRERIRAEYVEMPGLNLTVAQASRLFGIEIPRCAHVLDRLVEEGFLATRGRMYFRAVVDARSRRAS